MGKATNSIARKGSRGDFVPFHFPLAGCRGGAPAGAWGNAPTVPRTTGMPNALNKGAGSEASLPVTLRVRRRAPKLLFPSTQHCRTKWARPTSMGEGFLSMLVFFIAGEKRRAYPAATENPGSRWTIVLVCCRGCYAVGKCVTPARTASCTARRRSRLFAAAPRACRIR